jgi:hypothetical protein
LAGGDPAYAPRGKSAGHGEDDIEFGNLPNDKDDTEFGNLPNDEGDIEFGNLPNDEGDIEFDEILPVSISLRPLPYKKADPPSSVSQSPRTLNMFRDRRPSTLPTMPSYPNPSARPTPNMTLVNSFPSIQDGLSIKPSKRHANGRHCKRAGPIPMPRSLVPKEWTRAPGTCSKDAPPPVAACAWTARVASSTSHNTGGTPGSQAKPLSDSGNVVINSSPPSSSQSGEDSLSSQSDDGGSESSDITSADVSPKELPRHPAPNQPLVASCLSR